MAPVLAVLFLGGLVVGIPLGLFVGISAQFR